MTTCNVITSCIDARTALGEYAAFAEGTQGSTTTSYKVDQEERACYPSRVWLSQPQKQCV